LQTSAFKLQRAGIEFSITGNRYSLKYNLHIFDFQIVMSILIMDFMITYTTFYSINIVFEKYRHL